MLINHGPLGGPPSAAPRRPCLGGPPSAAPRQPPLGGPPSAAPPSTPRPPTTLPILQGLINQHRPFSAEFINQHQRLWETEWEPE